MRWLQRNDLAPALAPLLVIILAFLLALSTAGCASDPAAQRQALGFWQQLANRARGVGEGMQGAGAAIVPANPAAGGVVIALGSILSTIGGLFIKRRATWGTWTDRRKAKRDATWTPEQRQQQTTAGDSPAAERIPPRIDAGGPGPAATAALSPGQPRARARRPRLAA